MTSKIVLFALIYSLCIFFCIPGVICSINSYDPSTDPFNENSLTNLQNDDDDSDGQEFVREILKELNENSNQYTAAGIDELDKEFPDDDNNGQNIFSKNNPEWGDRAQFSEPTSSQTTSNSAQTSSNNNHYQGYSDDDDMQEVTLNASGKIHEIQTAPCTMIQIPLAKQSIQVTVNSVVNAQKVMLTTGQLGSCDEIFEFECPEDATFCERQELIVGGNMQLQQQGCNSDVAYLYVLPENFNNPMILEVNVTSLGNLQCKSTTPVVQPSTDHSSSNVTPIDNSIGNKNNNAATTNPDNFNEDDSDSVLDDEVYCSILDVDMCQPDPTDCNSSCMWVNCGINVGGTLTQTSGSCVPVNSTRVEIEGMCKVVDEFATTPVENQVIDYSTCQTQTPSKVIKIGNTEVGAHHVVGLILLFICTIFMAVVCCYRRHFRKHGTGLFNPPVWCPRFIFPRQLSGFGPIGDDGTELEYNPPNMAVL